MKSEILPNHLGEFSNISFVKFGMKGLRVILEENGTLNILDTVTSKSDESEIWRIGLFCSKLIFSILREFQVFYWPQKTLHDTNI